MKTVLIVDDIINYVRFMTARDESLQNLNSARNIGRAGQHQRMAFYKNVPITKSLAALRRDKHLEQIKQLYFEQKMNLLEIYKLTGVSTPIIRQMFKEHRLQLRTRSEAVRIGRSKKTES
jgi:hypothetical protein